MNWIKEWKEDYEKKGFKYFVLKLEDVFDSFSFENLAYFNFLLDKYNNYRKSKGKSINKYWVVNRDEDYADNVKEIIENNENIELKNNEQEFIEEYIESVKDLYKDQDKPVVL